MPQMTHLCVIRAWNLVHWHLNHCQCSKQKWII